MADSEITQRSPISAWQIHDTLNTTWVWWGSMLAVSALNVLFFIVVSRRVVPATDPIERKYQKAMKMLCVPFMFECAWRSVFPSLYNERQVLFDTPLNSILLDRSLAAIGEVCWVVQIDLALEQISSDLKRAGMKPCFGHCFVECLGVLMVLLAVSGECFSLTGTFTTNAIYEVYEASCWCTLFALGSLAALTLMPGLCRVREPSVGAKRFVWILWLQGLFYCPYMVISNIPMYYRIWQHDQANHKHYLPFMEGVVDAATRRIPTSDWEHWRSDWFWMSFYFSFAVWSSIALVNAPRLDVRARAGRFIGA